MYMNHKIDFVNKKMVNSESLELSLIILQVLIISTNIMFLLQKIMYPHKMESLLYIYGNIYMEGDDNIFGVKSLTKINNSISTFTDEMDDLDGLPLDEQSMSSNDWNLYELMEDEENITDDFF